MSKHTHKHVPSHISRHMATHTCTHMSTAMCMRVFIHRGFKDNRVGSVAEDLSPFLSLSSPFPCRYALFLRFAVSKSASSMVCLFARVWFVPLCRNDPRAIGRELCSAAVPTCPDASLHSCLHACLCTQGSKYFQKLTAAICLLFFIIALCSFVCLAAGFRGKMPNP